ncbi:hypothetical protein ACJX0J_012615, partial [Zea mays]
MMHVLMFIDLYVLMFIDVMSGAFGEETCYFFISVQQDIHKKLEFFKKSIEWGFRIIIPVGHGSILYRLLARVHHVTTEKFIHFDILKINIKYFASRPVLVVYWLAASMASTSLGVSCEGGLDENLSGIGIVVCCFRFLGLIRE